MPFCSKCGKNLEAGNSFCAFCGAPAAAAEPQAAPAVQPSNVAAPPVYPASQPLAVPGRNTFMNSYFSIVVLAALFIGLLTFGAIAVPDGRLFDPRALGFIFTQVCILGSIAFAVAVSTRSKGPDFSIGSVMALSSAIIGTACYTTASPILYIFISLFACAAAGLLNGAFITYLRAPAIIVTLLTNVIFRVVAAVLVNGNTLPVSDSIRAISEFRVGELSLGGLIILIVTFAAAFLMIMLTKLGVPTYKRDNKPALSYMFAYMASSIIAAVAGIFMASRLGAASPAAGNGYEPFIVVVFACVVGSRAMDNRFAPAVYVIAPVLFFSAFGVIAGMSMLDMFLQNIIEVVIALMLLAAAFLSRRFSTSYSDD